MPRYKILEALKRQREPGYVSIADEIGRTTHERYMETMDESVFRVANNDVVRQPNLKWAEDAAYAALLYLGMHFPPDPLLALRRLARVNVFTFREAATAMGMMHSEFEAAYGDMEAFTVRHVDLNDVVYYAVVYRPREMSSRLRFTLAHELGHVVMGHIGTRTADEKEADHFASCFLAPRCAMADLPMDRVLAKRCYITAKAAKACRCRRPQKVNPALMSLLNQWYKWEQQYSRVRREYTRMVNERYPGRPAHIAVEAEDRLYEVEMPGYRVVAELDPQRPYWSQFTPTTLPDIVFGVDYDCGKAIWDWGRRPHTKEEEDRFPLAECPAKAECPYAERCALDYSKWVEGAEEQGGPDRDILWIMNGDLTLRLNMCPFLHQEDECPPRQEWIAHSAKDIVRIEGKRQNKSKKSRKKG